VKIDEFKSAEEQLPTILRALSAVLPLAVEMKKIEVRIPPSYAAKSYGTLKGYKPVREEWLPDGTLKVVVEIPAGLQAEFFDRLNQLTRGEAQVKACE